MLYKFATIKFTKEYIPAFVISMVLILVGLYMKFLFVPVGFNKDIRKLEEEHHTEIEVEEVANREAAEEKIINETLRVHLSECDSKIITYKLIKEAAEVSGWDTISITAAFLTDYNTRQGVVGNNRASMVVNRLRYVTACLIYYRTHKYKCLSQIFLCKYDYNWETMFLSYRIMIKEGVRHEFWNAAK